MNINKGAAQKAAKILFTKIGCNCEIAVYAAACFARGIRLKDAVGEAMRCKSEGGRTVCGALVGANRVLDAISRPAEKERLTLAFASKFGSTMCSDLKLANVPDKVRREKCMAFISFALQETLEIMKSREN